MPVLRALVREDDSAKFEEELALVNKGTITRLQPLGMLMRLYISAPLEWFPSERQRKAPYPSEEDAVRVLDAAAPEAVERLAARGLWPLSWLDGTGPLFAAVSSAKRSPQPHSFAEVANVASMIPTIQAAASACASALMDSPWRDAAGRQLVLRGVRRCGDGEVRDYPARRKSAEGRAARLGAELLDPIANRFGFRAHIVEHRLIHGGGHSLQLDLPVQWGQNGNLSEELRFSRWLEESGGALKQAELIAV